jgi:hypothetical protein
MDERDAEFAVTIIVFKCRSDLIELKNATKTNRFPAKLVALAAHAAPIVDRFTLDG